MATTTKTTLRDWNNEQPITYLWIAGVGCPAGMDFRHNTETTDEEEYCDFAELDLLGRLWELEGAIDEHGRWCWDGQGDVRNFKRIKRAVGAPAGDGGRPTYVTSTRPSGPAARATCSSGIIPEASATGAGAVCTLTEYTSRSNGLVARGALHATR